MSLPTLVAEAVLSARADAIVAADSDGVIRFWNPGAERIFGYTRDEALGRSLNLIIPERLRQRHWEGYRKVMQIGQSRYGESNVLAVPACARTGRPSQSSSRLCRYKKADASSPSSRSCAT